ncbi:hypothetical protein CEXT_495201 [Caerostris extrusa]|uniref:Uncharacterized protein n=1 Tax=Caerostris extrusa TaxID=172846 RepID=A0AAV4WSX5_CAEEX|nr:hypothetical protein CEXT_495201 [Caerostris extrusa]
MSEPGFRTDPVFIANINLPGFRVFQGCRLSANRVYYKFLEHPLPLAVGDSGKRAGCRLSANRVYYKFLEHRLPLAVGDFGKTSGTRKRAHSIKINDQFDGHGRG